MYTHKYSYNIIYIHIYIKFVNIYLFNMNSFSNQKGVGRRFLPLINSLLLHCV